MPRDELFAAHPAKSNVNVVGEGTTPIAQHAMRELNGARSDPYTRSLVGRRQGVPSCHQSHDTMCGFPDSIQHRMGRRRHNNERRGCSKHPLPPQSMLRPIKRRRTRTV